MRTYGGNSRACVLTPNYADMGCLESGPCWRSASTPWLLSGVILIEGDGGAAAIMSMKYHWVGTANMVPLIT